MKTAKALKRYMVSITIGLGILYLCFLISAVSAMGRKIEPSLTAGITPVSSKDVSTDFSNSISTHARPNWLKPDETITDTINDRVFVIQGDLKESNSTRRLNKKILFVDTTGKLSKEVNIFPDTANRNLGVTIDKRKKFIWLYRSFGYSENRYKDIKIYNLDGELVFSEKRQGYKYVYMDDEKDRMLWIYPNEAILTINELNGNEVKRIQFSEQIYKSSLKSKKSGSDEFKGFTYNGKLSDNSNYLAYARNPHELNNYQPEIHLVDLSGNILFTKKLSVESVSPLFVFENKNVLVARVNKNKHLDNHGGNSYVGMNFQGNELWRLSDDDYYIDPQSTIGQDARLPVKKIEYIGPKNNEHVETRKANIVNIGHLDVLTGSVKEINE
jgi:hypothetical protein